MIVTTQRQATVDELAAEMDRRGAVIKTLEAKIASLRDSLLAERQAGMREGLERAQNKCVHLAQQYRREPQAWGDYHNAAHACARAIGDVLDALPTEDKQGSDGGGRDG